MLLLFQRSNQGSETEQNDATQGGSLHLLFLFQFEKAEYAGVPIDGLPSAKMTFALKCGNLPLDVVYVFSQGSAGRGELHEQCEGDTLLDDRVRGDNPVERYHICCGNGGNS